LRILGMTEPHLRFEGQMRIIKLIMRRIIVGMIALAPVQVLQAQDGDCGDDCKINTDLAMIVSVPVSSSAQVVGTGWGIVGGVGYNFNRRHATVGEFMWTRVYPSSGALQPLQTTLQSKDLSANTDIYALTANYRFELRGRFVGTYLIGGGGWYYRNTWLSMKVPSGTGNVCGPTWRWFGYSCTSGMVNPNQPPVESTSNALGANGGIGFTARGGVAPYRFYAEARYHYAPTKNTSTHLVAVTIGIRY
jgi:hypothetical protein